MASAARASLVTGLSRRLHRHRAGHQHTSPLKIQTTTHRFCWPLGCGHCLIDDGQRRPQDSDDGPWEDVPPASRVEASHSRRVRRTRRVLTAPKRVDFPRTPQATDCAVLALSRAASTWRWSTPLASRPWSTVRPEAIAADSRALKSREPPTRARTGSATSSSTRGRNQVSPGRAAQYRLQSDLISPPCCHFTAGDSHAIFLR